MWCTTTPAKEITAVQSTAIKGFDSASYYMMSSDPTNPYANYSGTGNTLNFGKGHVRKMVMDSLRYWKQRDAHRRLPLRSRLRLQPQ